MTWRVPLTDVTIDEAEVAAATRVLRSGWLTMGPETEAFESEFAAMLGVKNAVAVTNGTAALHLAYEALGLAEGDEFCIPALTFVATMNAGLYLRACPVLIDSVSESDLTLSTEDLARKITPKTRLIVSVPYAGFPPDMQAICAIAQDQGIPLVEDACHAPLAELNGQKIGTFGAASTWSFFGNKNMTTGEGGMITTNDETLAKKLALMRSHGMTTQTWERHAQASLEGYDVIETGHNFRIDEIRAAVGREQIKKLPQATEGRRRAYRELCQALEPLETNGLKIPFKKHRGVSAHHLFVILLPPGIERDSVRQILHERGIQTSIHYPPLHTLSHVRSLFQACRLPVLESVAKRLLSLPISPTLTSQQIIWIGDVLKESIRR